MTNTSNVGLTCLFNGGENPKADVVLVHGFGGHPESTWSKSTSSTKQDEQRVPDEAQTRDRQRDRVDDVELLKEQQANAQGIAIVPIGNTCVEGSQLNQGGSVSSDASSKVFWPQDLLGRDFPSVRVMTYGYQPDQEEPFQANLLSLSNHLLSTLESERRGVPGRPIIFIAHSLGGILVKKALDLSRRSTASIRNVTKETIFFGTPHSKPHGESWSGLLKKIPSEFAATNTTLVATLDSQHNEEELESIKDTFEKMLDRPKDKKIFVVIFTGAVVGGPPGSISELAVPVASARVNSSWTKIKTLEGSHETMCQFGSPNDSNYQLLEAELRLSLQRIDNEKRKQEKKRLKKKIKKNKQKQEFLAEGEWFPKLLTCPYWERKDEPNPPQTEGTFEWFLNHSLYKHWRSSHVANVLWVSADPGCGKSVLARHVAENVLPSSNKRLTCYFFFNSDYSDQRSVTDALFCILHQVFKDFSTNFPPKVLQTATENYEKTLELFHDLWAVLLSVAERQKFKEVICILDALDESSEPGRSQFIDALGKLYSQSQIKPVRLKFLVTSRPCLDASSLDRLRVSIHLSGESDGEVGMISEIRFAIQQKAGRLIQKHRLGPEDGDFLIAELCRNPNPTYLWVHLVIEEADNILLTQENIRSKIQNLPQTVDEAYENILAKVKDAESARRVLHIILAAQRPLTLKEMSFALAIGPSHKPPDDNKSIPETKVCNDIQDLCGAFVRIVNSKIYLVHQTAREFLVSSDESVQPSDANDGISPTSSSQWKSTFQPQESNQILAEICLWRIALSDCRLDQHQGNMEIRDAVKGCPLMSYAAQHWAEHFRKGGGMHKPSIIKTAMDFFTARPLASQAWFKIYQAARNFYIGPDKPTALTLAAYFGLGVVIERLPRGALDTVNEKSSGFASLQWAARGGHRGVVQQLIAAGADINLKGEDGRAALHFAAERNDRALIQQLVAAGANINIHDVVKRTPLHLAAGKGYHDMVQQLLTAGAAANMQDAHGKTALLSAIDSGHFAIVQRLLAGGSNVSIQDTMGQTALQRAAKRGHIDIVQLLMGAGADLRVQDNEGQTALHYAAAQDREAVVQQLIAAGSDIRTGDKRNRTPLEQAARKGSRDVVRQLIEAGSEINHQDRDGNTALIWAARKRNNAVMRQLIAAGADMALHDKAGRTPFLWAALLGHLTTVQQLIAAGADVSVRDPGGRTALDLATAKGRVGVQQFLERMNN
ncbi:unnamed protein product [Clonostachys solani]|uniref:NACHT domain-containing protein n=1 Tax=Clonostachys solani TaxID=160281 RepID=A0A9N9YZR7_9HYPO|nr:unnamed protein product [Clonostachys solani]